MFCWTYSFVVLNTQIPDKPMSHTLYLVRHAEAEDASAFQRDHDRELVPPGIMAAARIGHYLHDQHIVPERLLSSTANRAKDTAKVVAEQLGIKPDTIELIADLYDGGPRAYLAALNALPGACGSVMLFGHNPDISYFAEFLTHESLGDMDKGAVAAIEFDDLNWDEISGRTGTLAFYVSPNHLPDRIGN